MRRFIYEEPVSRAAVWSRRIAVFALAVLLVSVATFRLGDKSMLALAPLVAGFALAGLAIQLAITAFVRIWFRGQRGTSLALQGFALGLLLLLPLAFVTVQVARLPYLNDVSTDLDDPPTFSRSGAVLAARGGRIPPDASPESRRRQREGYPQIAPILVDVTAAEAFDAARRAAISLRWEVLENAPPVSRAPVGRIEAVDTSRIMRFADDISIRVRPQADGARIDIRSASRLGEHDLGANAARIMRFADEVNAIMASK
jgi:uncharacterized protein (DUF1499 family)